MKINLVSDLRESIWRREAQNVAKESWIYSKMPVSADVYVVYGKVEPLVFPSSSAIKIFIAIEPPEIFRYDLDILALYDLVISPDFLYTQTLPNRVVESGLLNWSVGTLDHVHNFDLQRELPSVEDISALIRNPTISVIMSLKSMTPMQKRRIAFVHELHQIIPELKVYGRHSNPISDKLEGLLPHRFHLAIENSIHPAYWTEKLADPLLCLAKVFYIGDPFAVKDFDDKCIVPLDIEDTLGSAQIIRDHLQRGVSDSDMASLIGARSKIIRDRNVHSVVEAQLHDWRDGDYSSIPLTSISAHHIQVSSRLRFWKDRIRLTTLQFKKS